MNKTRLNLIRLMVFLVGVYLWTTTDNQGAWLFDAIWLIAFAGTFVYWNFINDKE